MHVRIFCFILAEEGVTVPGGDVHGVSDVGNVVPWNEVNEVVLVALDSILVFVLELLLRLTWLQPIRCLLNVGIVNISFCSFVIEQRSRIAIVTIEHHVLKLSKTQLFGVDPFLEVLGSNLVSELVVAVIIICDHLVDEVSEVGKI